MDTDKLDELNKTIKEINSKLKKAKISSGAGKGVERIPSGSYGIDYAIGGGWPTGRFALLWGSTSSGKTALSLLTIANAQKMGKKCLFIDAEKTLESAWATHLGVDVDDLIYAKVNRVEEVLQTCVPLMQRDLVDVVVIDSINDISYTKYFDDENHSIGLFSRGIGEIISKLNEVNTKTLVLMISQQRTKFEGNYVSQGPSGGNAIEYGVSLSVKLTSGRGELIATDKKIVDTITGKYVKWIVDKTKISMPWVAGQYVWSKQGGIDDIEELTELAIQMEVLEKAGSWYTYKENKVQGLDGLVELVRDDEELQNEILKRIYG